jgi:hypothetical protein
MKAVRISQIRRKLFAPAYGTQDTTSMIWEYRQIIEELLREVTIESFNIIKLKREVMRLLKEGKKIHAIKLYRQETGCGLKEAKDFIESIQFTTDRDRKKSWQNTEKAVALALGKKKRLRHRPAPKSKKRKAKSDLISVVGKPTNARKRAITKAAKSANRRCR